MSLVQVGLTFQIFLRLVVGVNDKLFLAKRNVAKLSKHGIERIIPCHKLDNLVGHCPSFPYGMQRGIRVVLVRLL
jgi:hypothetical protein